MVDDTKPSGPPRRDINQQRAASINSMNNTMERLKSTAEDIQIDAGTRTASARDISSVTNMMNKVLANIEKSVSVTMKGIKDVSAESLRVVSETADINKTRLVAQTLARATPLFGHFAVKFMETNVWKNFSAKVKQEMGTALAYSAGQFKQAIGSIGSKAISLIPGIGEKEKRTAQVNDVALRKRIENLEKEVPKLQKGGVVGKGGLAYVHPAEVVAPAEKIVSGIGEKFNEATQKQMKSLQGMIEFAVDVKKNEYQGLFAPIKTFFKSYKKALGPKNTQELMLRQLIQIRQTVSPLSKQSFFREAWAMTLTQHPMFRLLVSSMKKLTTSAISVITFPFRMAGGYEAEIPKQRAGSIFSWIGSMIYAGYGHTARRLDLIKSYTRQTAERLGVLISHVTGQKVGPVKDESKKKTWLPLKVAKRLAIGAAGLQAASYLAPLAGFGGLGSLIGGGTGAVGGLLGGGTAISVISQLLPAIGALLVAGYATKKLVGVAKKKQLPGGIDEKVKALPPGQPISEQISLPTEELLALPPGESSYEKITMPKHEIRKLEITRESGFLNILAIKEMVYDIKKFLFGKSKEDIQHREKSHKVTKSIEEKASNIYQEQSKTRKGLHDWMMILFPTFIAIKNVISRMFRKVGMIGKGIFNIGRIIGSGLVGTMSKLSSFLAKSILGIAGTSFGSVLFAGAGGYLLGSLLNKFIINPLQEKWKKEREEKRKSAIRVSEKKTSGIIEGLKTALPEEEEAARQRVSIIGKGGGLGEIGKRRRESYGGILTGVTGIDVSTIQAAQDAMMAKHADFYRQYATNGEQLARLRGVYLSGPFAFRTKNATEDEFEYGLKRELMFQEWLKLNAKKIQDLGLDIDYSTAYRIGKDKEGIMSAIGKYGSILMSPLHVARRIGFQYGGVVKGRPGVDMVPAMLTAGEYVLTEGETSTMIGSLKEIERHTGTLAKIEVYRFKKEKEAERSIFGEMFTREPSKRGTMPGITRVSKPPRIESATKRGISGISEEIVWPTEHNVITSGYGPRRVPGGSKFHRGVDIRARMGDPVYSVLPGTVSFVGGNYGTVDIEHEGGLRSRYLHLSGFGVSKGDKVEAGQIIGTAGGTGPYGTNQYTPHLHFDLRRGKAIGKSANWINPENWFRSKGSDFSYKGGAIGGPGISGHVSELGTEFSYEANELAKMDVVRNLAGASMISSENRKLQGLLSDSVSKSSTEVTNNVTNLTNSITNSLRQLNNSGNRDQSNQPSGIAVANILSGNFN